MGYDRESLITPEIRKLYKGEITTDGYGRKVPKSAHGTVNLDRYTSSTKLIIDAVMDLFERIVDKNLLIRRVNISANHVVEEGTLEKTDKIEQLNLFIDYNITDKKKEKEEAELVRERKVQETILNIKERYGKNAVLKGLNLEDGATTVDRNKQIGGHKA